MSYQPYDRLIVAGRPAVFLWWQWKGRTYARVRFSDTNECAVAHTMDIQPLAEACVDALKAAGFDVVEEVSP